jgi:imidazolonepropionase-like amidohydrolase
MRHVRYLFSWLLAALTLAGFQPLATADSGAALALTGARIFDATGGPPIEGVVLIRGKRIAAVGPGEQIALPDNARVIDLRGHWIVPGLIDAHVHFFQSGSLYTRPDVIDLRRFWPYAREIARIRAHLPTTLKRYLASGITSVVDMAGPEWVLGVRDLAEQTSAAPRVAVAGPGLAPRLPPALSGKYAPALVVRTPQEARSAVRRLAARYPDLIKIWFVPTPAMDLEQEYAWINAAVDESHAIGLRVAAHATELELARRMVRAGVDILVHGVDDKPVDATFIDLLKRRRTLYVTTLSVSEGYREALSQEPRLSEIERRLADPAVIASLDDLSERFPRYRPPRALPENRIAMHNLQRVHAAGITVAAGSDAGNIGTLPGPALHVEMELMSQAGLSPGDILLAATRNGALLMDRENDLGTLQPGKLADMLILNADPLEDIRHTRRITAVVKDGVLYRPERLMEEFQNTSPYPRRLGSGTANVSLSD